MCLGIVGRVTALATAHPDLAEVDVAGVVRPINVGLLDGIDLRPGDWILIHAGFAMERIDQETARATAGPALRAYVRSQPEDG